MLRMLKRYGVPTLLTLVFVTLVFIQPRVIYGSSMEPTLKDGQLVLVLRYARQASRNDIWACEINSKKSVKRVVGLPGEFIEVRDGSIFIDGVAEGPYFKTPENWYEVLLKEDEYFLVGDNRAHSSDSILFGPVNVKDMYGKVTPF